MGRLGDLLGRLVGTGLRLGVLGLSGEPLGAFLEASLGPLGALLGHLGALLGRLGLLWVCLGALLGRFGPPWGPSWDDLWSLLGRFRPFLARNGENPKTHQKPKENL